MKIFMYIVGLLVTLLIGIYALLFTGLGNSLLRPVVESKIGERLKMPVKLKKFHLSMNDLELIIYLTNKNGVRIYGDYSLFAQSFDLKYDIKLLSLSELEPLTKRQLAGELKSKGTLKGTPELINIDGISDIARSATSYHIELTKFDVTSIKARIKSLQVGELLAILKKPKYAYALLDLDLDFKNIKPHQLDGVVHLATQKGHFVSAVVKRELGVRIPHTRFSMQLDAKLKQEDIEYDSLFDSNLMKLATSGNVTPDPLQTDLVYKASIKELALLKPLTNADLRGSLNLHGTLKGDKKRMLLELFSDVASSKTSALVTLQDLRPSSVDATLNHIRLEKLFYMLKQPRYASGDCSIKAKIENLKLGELKGDITTITTGEINNLYMSKRYKFKHPMPKAHFRLRSISTLDGSNINTLATLASNLANVSVKEARFDLNKMTLDSDYMLNIPSLKNLYFVTERELRGKLDAQGEIHSGKTVHITAKSKVAGGLMEVKLENDKLHIDLSDVETKQLLWMFAYPEILNGDLFAKVDYDLAKQKGIATANLKDGKFAKNNLFDLLNRFKKVDLYREYFNGNAKADINKEKIATVFDLKARKAEIKSDRTLLDTKRSQIDSVLHIKVEKTPVTVLLSGDIDKPKIDVDMQAFMRTKEGKKLEKKANKEIKRFLKKIF